MKLEKQDAENKASIMESGDETFTSGKFSSQRIPKRCSICDLVLNATLILFFAVTTFGINNELHAQCPSSNLLQASEYSLLTFGNFTCNQGDQIWGRAAVGGNFTVSNWGIGANGCLSNNAARVDLVIGGNLNYSGGQVSNGSVVYGGSLISSPSLAVGGATITQNSSYINFSSIESAIKANSAYWSTLPTTGSINDNGFGTIELTGANSTLNVFNLTASQVSLYSYLNIKYNVPTSSTVLVNIIGALTNMPQTTVEYNGSQISTGTIGSNYQTCPQSRIIWNLSNATTSLQMTGVGFQGTLLAPWASISSQQGEINGQIICQSMSQSQSWAAVIQVHCTRFQGCLPTNTPSCTADAGANQTACGGTCINLTGITPNNGTWSSMPGNPSGSTLGITTGGVAEVCFALNASGTYNFIYHNGTSCEDTMSVILTAPPIADAGSTQNLDCSTTSGTIGTASILGNTYSWSPAAGLSATNIAQPTANPTATTTYTVTVTGANGCTASSTVLVNVNTIAPIVTISGGTIVCDGSTTTLTASGANTYMWSNTDLTASTVVGVGTYTVTGTASNGCTSTSSVDVINQQGNIGNYVWLDENRNGLNDEGSSYGINGVTVELWNATTNMLIQSTTTANDGLGHPGYYNFAICSNGDYQVKFPTTNGVNNNPLTVQTTTTGIDNNSDANIADGFSPVFAININGAGVAKDNLTIDAGYLPKQACIGNYVWNDKNYDGVQNNNEIGVSGVTVSLVNASNNTILATMNTDAYGFYQFCGLNAGNYKVQFSLPANYVFTGQNAPNDNIDSDPNVFTGLTDTYVLIAGDSNMTVDAGIYQPIPVTATVGDRVWFDVDGNGVQDIGESGMSGITVTLYNCSNPGIPAATTITDAGGNYLFENVLAGSYKVEFSTPIGMVLTTQTGSISSTTNSDADSATGQTPCFAVVGGDNITYVDAGLKPKPITTASLGDKVWNDVNQDGVQDVNETGVQGVVVSLYDASGTTLISSTETNSLGNYSFNAIPAGCYKISFGLPSGYTHTIQGAGSDSSKNSDANASTGMTNQICIAAGQNNPTIDAGIYNAANTNSLGDKVWYDVDKDGIQELGEYGYPGVVVTLYDCTTNTIQATTTTDANGNYLFDGVANGNYYVGFGFVAGYQFTAANADLLGIAGGNNSDANPSTGLTQCVSLTGNTNITSIDAGIYPGNTRNATSSLGDVVWVDVNNNGLQDAGEPGVAGVTVTLYEADGISILATTTTDGAGEYIFTNLTEGEYVVGFTPSTLPAGHTFTTQGSNIEDQNNSDANMLTGRTNLITLGLGEDKMNVDAGIVSPLGTVCLGDYVWIDLDNDGIQEGNEPAVPGVTVKLYDNNTNTVLQVATTNREGNYLFCGLTTGNTYSVGFENLPAGFTFTTSSGALSTLDNSDANPTTGRTATLTLGATNDLTVDAGIYSPTTAVVGNYVWYDEDADGIQDPTEAPIPGVLVTLYDNTNTPVASAVTDANGGYLFTNVAPGTYTIGFEGYPSTLIPTTKGANPSADDDSNIDPITGRTDAFIVTPGSSNLTLDAGYKANPIAGLGNYVWYDINEDGLQDASEPGISGVIVSLFESDGSTLIATAITDGNGAYSFPNLPAGSYVVGFTAPLGYTRTKSVGGLNDALNSDVDVTNKTAVVTLIAGEYNPNIDAGYYIGVPLPAKVLQATLANMTSANTCEVSWYTKDEENTQRFEIERGVNRQEFEKVATHKASGQTFGLTNYSVVDDLSAVSSNAVVYYRIKLIDIDGKFTYSNVISAVRGSSNDALMIYPNPFENALNIDYVAESDDVLELTLTDLSGRVVSRMQKTITKGANKITWNNLGSLSSGQYYIRVSSLENGNSYLRKLNK